MQSGDSASYPLHFSGSQFQVEIGSNWFFPAPGRRAATVFIDNVALIGLRIEDGQYLLNMGLFDEFNNPILAVIDNALEFSVDPWDIQFVGRVLTIRSAARKIFIETSSNRLERSYSSVVACC